MRKTKKIFAIILSTLIIFNQSIGIMANEDVSDDNKLLPYIMVLQEFNEEFDTDYQFDLTGNDSEDNDIIDFYTNMSISEFDRFLKDVYENDMEAGLEELQPEYSQEIEAEFPEEIELEIEPEFTEGIAIMPLTLLTSVKHKFYYSSNSGNYLYFNADLNLNVSNMTFNTIKSSGSVISSYPGYKMLGIIYAISTDRQYCATTINYQRYAASGLLYTTVNSVKLTFKAGSNIYYTY